MKIQCPFCGGSQVIRQRHVSHGRQRTARKPRWQCSVCHQFFGTRPWFGRQGRDSRKMVRKITFADGGYFGGWQTVCVECDRKVARGYRLTIGDDHATLLRPPVNPRTLPPVVDLTWDVIINRLYNQVWLNDWRSEYANYRGICDGEQWKITMVLNNGEQMTYSGDNNFPALWEPTRELFDELFQQPDADVERWP